MAIAPSDAVVGESFEVIVRGEDLWGNATPLPDRPLLKTSEGDDLAIDEVHVVEHPPAMHFSARCDRPRHNASVSFS